MVEISMAMFLLRWRFDYADRPSKTGQWSRAATIETDMAYYQNKEGIVRASIEGKDVITREIKTLAECDGWDYVNFQWMDVVRGRSDGLCTRQHIGLKLITRDFWVEVYAKGLIKKIPRTEEDKNYHYATFGR
jgi:hypothetical protein